MTRRKSEIAIIKDFPDKYFKNRHYVRISGQWKNSQKYCKQCTQYNKKDIQCFELCKQWSTISMQCEQWYIVFRIALFYFSLFKIVHWTVMWVLVAHLELRKRYSSVHVIHYWHDLPSNASAILLCMTCIINANRFLSPRSTEAQQLWLDAIRTAKAAWR